jgi:hypothetical protein
VPPAAVRIIHGFPAIGFAPEAYVRQIVEHRLGEALDAQARWMLDGKDLGTTFECGTTEGEKSGRNALNE